MDSKELDTILNDRNTDDSLIPDAQPPTVPNTDTVSCPECGKMFTGEHRELALNGHMRSHTGAKTSVKSTKDTSILPENLAFLNQQLKAFGAKGATNIIAGMQDNPLDLNELRDLLTANENKSNVPYILKRYSNFTGVAIPEEKSVQSQSGFSDMFGMAKQAMELKMMQNLFGGGEKDNKSNPELDAVKLQLAKMEEHNKKLEELLVKQQTDNRIAQLETEFKKSKEESDGQVGQLASLMKSFASDQSHSMELLKQEVLHQRETDELKKKIEEAYMPRSESMQLAREIKDGIVQGAGYLGKLNVDIARDTLWMDKVRKVEELKGMGFDNATIAQIMSSQRPIIPRNDAELEWQKLQRANELAEAQKRAQEQQTVTIPQPTPTEQPAEPAMPPVVFATKDNER